MIIDAHTHYGESYKGGMDFNIENYLKYMKENNIEKTIMMITPMPISHIKHTEISETIINNFKDKTKKDIEEHLNEEPMISLIHYIRDNKKSQIKHYKGIKINENIILEELTQDPYLIPNKEFFNFANQNKNICPILTIHPLFFNPKEYENLNPLGYKIHGIATCTSPKDISNSLIDFLKEKDKPLVVHTEYSEKAPKYKSKTFKDNSALNWILFAKNNDIKIYLTHGARLSQDAINIANNYNKCCIGIGPDLELSSEKNRLEYNVNDVQEYLKILYESVSPEILCFDSDYPWNKSEQYKSYDWQTLNRLNEIVKNQYHQDMILGENAKMFFEVK